MYLNTDYVDPAELTGYVRRAAADLEINQFTLSQYLPSQVVNDLDYRFTRGGEGLIEAATYRSYDAEAPLASRPGMTRTAGQLPPISRKIRLGEYDRLKSRNLPNEVRTAIFTDADRLTRAISARIELARGQALVQGKVSIAENGVVAGVDFGRASALTVTAPTLWTNTTSATPISDLMAWRDAYIAINGGPPGIGLTSQKTLSLLLRNQEIRNLTYPGANQPSLVTQTSVDQVLTAFGLVGFNTYDVQVRVAGVNTRVIPDNVVIFLPTGADQQQLGRVLWGTTLEAQSAGYGLAGAEAGIVAGTHETWDPIALWTKAAAIALPVLVNPNLVMVATVA